MKSRAERDREIEAIKANLFDAGLSTVKAAQAHEEFVKTSLEALADALEPNRLTSSMLNSELLELSAAPLATEATVAQTAATNPIYKILVMQREAAKGAGDYEAYIEVEEKLQHLEELEVQRLERDARRAEAQVRVAIAQTQLSASPPKSPASPTEKHLKEKYKSLKDATQALGISAKSWGELAKKIDA